MFVSIVNGKLQHPILKIRLLQSSFVPFVSCLQVMASTNQNSQLSSSERSTEYESSDSMFERKIFRKGKRKKYKKQQTPTPTPRTLGQFLPTVLPSSGFPDRNSPQPKQTKSAANPVNSSKSSNRPKLGRNTKGQRKISFSSDDSDIEPLKRPKYPITAARLETAIENALQQNDPDAGTEISNGNIPNNQFGGRF